MTWSTRENACSKFPPDFDLLLEDQRIGEITSTAGKYLYLLTSRISRRRC